MKKYSAMMQEHQIETDKILAGRLIEFGKAAGFSFSKDDLMAARAELIDTMNSNGELSDDDLEKVAGGGSFKGMAAIMSVMTAGAACVALSVNAEIFSGGGGCGKVMTTRC